MRAIVAIVDPVEGAADCAERGGLVLDVLETAEARGLPSTLVEVEGEAEAVRALLTHWGFTAADVPQYFYGLDGYGDPYPYEIPARLLDDPTLNNRSDLDSGPSFNCMSEGEGGLSDKDQGDVLWVGAPDAPDRFLITSQGGGQDWRGGDVEAAVAELRRRWAARD